MAKPDIILKLKAVCLTRWRLCRVPGAARLVPRVLHQLLHRQLNAEQKRLLNSSTEERKPNSSTAELVPSSRTFTVWQL